MALEVAGRRTDVSFSDRPPLGIVAGEEAITTPSFDHRSELPTEVHCIGDPGIHAEGTRRGELMYRVTEEMNRPLRIAFRHDTAPRPYANTDPFHVDVPTYRAAQIGIAVDTVRIEVRRRIEYHQPPESLHRVDDTDIRPEAVAVHRQVEGSALDAELAE